MITVEEAKEISLRNSKEVYDTQIRHIEAAIRKECKRGNFKCYYRFDPEEVPIAIHHKIVLELLAMGFIRDTTPEQVLKSSNTIEELCWDDQVKTEENKQSGTKWSSITVQKN
jgi:hypothetical protein